MVSCTIFSHHISNPSSFCDSKVFYMLVCFFVSSFYLSDYRQYIYWSDIFDFQRLISLRN